MDSDMTPLNRLIPQSSGSQEPHRSERETMRANVSGSGMIPSMRPMSSGDANGDDIVNEILRDTEIDGGDEDYQEYHPSDYQEPEYDERPRSPSPPSANQRMVHFEDEPRRPVKDTRKERDEEDSDYIGMILEEMKLPLIVAILILGASSTGLDNTISRLIPALVNDGNLGYGGIVIKAVVGGLLFYVLRRIFL